jgi:hypothetical protein
MATAEQLRQALTKAQNNPNSSFATELRKRIEAGNFDSQLSELGVQTPALRPTLGNEFLEQDTSLKGSNLLQKVRNFATTVIGGREVARGIGLGLAAPETQRRLSEAEQRLMDTDLNLIKRIQEKVGRGEDTSRLENAREQLLSDMKFSRDIQEDFIASLPSNTQVIGSAVRLAGTLSAGSLAGGVTTGTSFQLAEKGAKSVGGLAQLTGADTAATILGGIGRGAIAGAGTGAITGGIQGAGLAAEADAPGEEIISRGVQGTIGGGIAGGVIGGLVGGVSGGLKGAALRKAQTLKELETNPDLVAKYNLNNKGALVEDRNAQELIRQGMDEKHVAVLKNASAADKQKLKEMVAFADKATKDARAIDRPSDVVGDTIVERTKHVATQLKTSGKALEGAAKSLRGQKVDPIPATQTFIDDLSEMGVTFKNGKPVFDGSNIEGITPAENLVKRVVDRANTVSDDAFEIHQLKKFIDEQVTFGKQGEGIAGQTERILKLFRRNLDQTLDTNFTQYRDANAAYSAARDLLDDTKQILGQSFDLNEGSIRAGAIARRVLGNSANRGDILEYLNALEKYFKSTGGKGGGDVITQTVFADILEDIYGTQATTGLQGQVQRGIEQAGGVVQDLGQGQLITGLTRGAVRLMQASQGITPQAKITALKALIGGVQ